MKKVSKILLVLLMVFAIGGCGKNECKCPSDTDGTVNGDKTTEITDWTEKYLSTVRSVVLVKIQRKSDKSTVATGSGVVVYEEGNYAYIYTNAHVVKDMNSDYEIEVFFADEEGDQSGDSEIASLMGKDYNEDVAVLEIRKSNKYTVAKLGNSYNVEVGDAVYTIGSPLGIFDTLTVGVVSNVNNSTIMDSVTGLPTVAYNSILFDASLNRGNSGGALFNANGEIIGITTLKYTDTSGMNVALSIDYFSKVANYLLVNGRDYVRPTLSLNIKSISEMGTLREKYGISGLVKVGVFVETSFETLISSQSVITEVNGIKVKSISEYNVELLKYNIGDTVTLTLTNKDGLNLRNVSVVLHG